MDSTVFDTFCAQMLANGGLWFITNPENQEIYNKGLDGRSALPIFSSVQRGTAFLKANRTAHPLGLERVGSTDLLDFLEGIVQSEFVDVDSVRLDELNRVETLRLCRFLRASWN